MQNLTHQRRVLVAAHRGTAGGNIPCNTLTAYELALRDGADIIELDCAVGAVFAGNIRSPFVLMYHTAS